MKSLVVSIVFLFCLFSSYCQQMSLAGKWDVRLDSGNHKTYTMQLPGTLDDAGIGNPVEITPKLDMTTLVHLTRKVEYTGKAYYTRTFTTPASWTSKKVELVLGRVLWKSSVEIDGKPVTASQESLVTPHVYDLTSYVKAGKTQTITLCIDNSNIYPGINIYSTTYPKGSEEMTHSYTNHTQIKWNGVLGSLSLIAKPKISIGNVQVSSDMESKSLRVLTIITNESNNKAKLISYVTDANGKRWLNLQHTSTIAGESAQYTIPLQDDVVTWSEFTPSLYTLVTIVQTEEGCDTVRTKFGIRNLQARNGDLYLNNSRIFIRGNLECIIFPKTGYSPMQKGEWLELFRKAKLYGLNTFRFHSWCPPAAAFEAADDIGFYIQVELPHWSLQVGKDTAALSFLRREAKAIITDYGNHPSFFFFSMGNELEGDFSELNQMVAELKKEDSRHLYSTTTFTFQKEITGAPQPQDDYYVTQWTKKGWVRGQGIFNDEPPSFSKDYTAAADSLSVPIISHEIGQYSVYPDMSEIGKYKGNLRPLNFVAIKNDLQKKGLLSLSPSFLKASGKFAALLYKEEIERALKTKSFDGFQLLQLQDFPGQGTALVGLLNAFWESKGIVTPQEFHQYNSEVTPLIRYPKAVYTNDETFTAEAELANFYKPLDAEVVWEISDDKTVLRSGSFGAKKYEIGNGLAIGQIQFDLKQISSAKKLTVKLSVKNSTYQNQWNIWVYPAALPDSNGDVLVTSSLQESLQALEKGRKVLLCPQPDTLNGITGKFVPVFWSPIHFPDQPGTMGLLIKDKHKALANFPTDDYSNWQWWDLTIKSKTLNAGALPDEAIIVRVIDNFVRNQSLTNLFEVKYGKGSLMFCSIDIMNDLDKRPQAKQLRYSLLKYMNTKDFTPVTTVTQEQLKSYFK